VVFIWSALTNMVFLRPAFLIRDMSTFTKDRLCWLTFRTCWVKSSGASMCAIFQEVCNFESTFNRLWLWQAFGCSWVLYMVFYKWLLHFNMPPWPWGLITQHLWNASDGVIFELKCHSGKKTSLWFVASFYEPKHVFKLGHWLYSPDWDSVKN